MKNIAYDSSKNARPVLDYVLSVLGYITLQNVQLYYLNNVVSVAVRMKTVTFDIAIAQ